MLWLGQTRRPSAVVIFIKTNTMISDMCLGSGLVKTIYGPSAAATTGKGTKRYGLIYQTNKFLADV